jgi:hypothetical protein
MMRSVSSSVEVGDEASPRSTGLQSDWPSTHDRQRPDGQFSTVIFPRSSLKDHSVVQFIIVRLLQGSLITAQKLKLAGTTCSFVFLIILIGIYSI